VTSDLEPLWDELSHATPPGWRVGRPSFHDEVDAWEQYAYDATERPVVGKRSRESTSVGATEVDVVREMARCLTEIGQGRVPR